MRSTRSLIAVFADWGRDAPQEGDELTHNGATWVVDAITAPGAWTTVIQLSPQEAPAATIARPT